MATNPRKNRLTRHALDGSFLYPDDHGDWVPFAEALAIKRERDALAARVDYLENRLGLTTMDEEGEKVELPEEFDGVAWRDRLIEKLEKRIEKLEAEQGRPSESGGSSPR